MMATKDTPAFTKPVAGAEDGLYDGQSVCDYQAIEKVHGQGSGSHSASGGSNACEAHAIAEIDILMERQHVTCPNGVCKCAPVPAPADA